jgi:hypothetical protein
LVLGQFLGVTRLGRIAFLVTVGAAFLGGVFLAVPSALGFTIAILIRWRRGKASPSTGPIGGA